MSIASQLSHMLYQKQISQTKLAALTGLSKSSISQYVSGVFVPPITTLAILANALDCSIAELEGNPPAAESSQNLKSLSVTGAARLMGKSSNFVKQGLIDGRLDIGTAVWLPAQERWSFHIPPKRFESYMNGREDKENLTNEMLKLLASHIKL